MNKLLIILGPTATGKTDLALTLAKKFNGELVACDSRQVYQGLDIGTGKMPGKVTIDNGQLKIKKKKGMWEIDGIRVWMYDVVELKTQYSVADYVKDAAKVIKDISDRGRLPIIVVGTGLYLKALLEGLPNLKIPTNKKLRKSLDKLSVGELQKKLQVLSPIKWQSLNDSEKGNKRRLIRKIELILMNPDKNKFKIQNLKFKIPNTLKIGLAAPRSTLNQRIDSRILSRLDQGMVEEAAALREKGLSIQRMKELGLEYGVLADYLQSKELVHLAGNIKTLDELVKVMQTKIHQYAKRQMTWFKREQNVVWFDITDKNWQEKVEKLASNWYNT